MITRFSVSNYKCLVDVDVPLTHPDTDDALSQTPMHVFIGKNDSGKTSLLEAIYALSKSASSPLEQAFPGDWQGMELINESVRNESVRKQNAVRDHDPVIRLRADLEGGGGPKWGKFRYELALEFPEAGRSVRIRKETVEFGGPINGKTNRYEHSVVLNSRGSTISALAEGEMSFLEKHQGIEELDWFFPGDLKACLGPAVLYQLDPRQMATPAGISSSRRYRMDRDGFGLATLLDDILSYQPERFLKISEQFCNLFGEYRGVRIETRERAVARTYDMDGYYSTSRGDGKAILFKTSNGEMRASQASDGALLFLAFLAIAYTPPPYAPRLHLLEEPERGVYPTRLGEIVGILRHMRRNWEPLDESSGVFPQVCLTTHSPYLLSMFEPEEVTFLTRRPDGSVWARPLRDAPESMSG